MPAPPPPSRPPSPAPPPAGLRIRAEDRPVRGSPLGSFRGAAVRAVGDGEKREGLPERPGGKTGKNAGLLDHVGAPEKPVAGPPGPCNPESPATQGTDLLPHGSTGRPHPPADPLAGHEPPPGF